MGSKYKSSIRLELGILMNNRGFTIFEILIAITILSFMMFGIVSISTDSLDTKDRVLSEDRETLQVESAFSVFNWDFSQLYSPMFFSTRFTKKNEHDEEAYEALMERYSNNPNFDAPDKDGLPIPKIVSENKKELLFFTISNRRKIEDSKSSKFAWVKYQLISVEKNEDNEFDTGQAIARYFKAKDPYSNEKFDTENIKPQILLKNLKELKFEFWNPSTQKFVNDLSTVPNGNTKLDAVRLSFTWIDKVGSEREEERIFRVNWPYFDPAEDEREIAKANPTAANTQNNNNNSNGTDPNTNNNNTGDED
jgi:hypothetical protein